MEDLYLAHHGIKGQRWGIRRFQRKDGTVTPAGKKRYESDNNEEALRKAKRNKALKIGAAVAGTALATYGTYKLTQFVKNKKIENAKVLKEALNNVKVSEITKTSVSKTPILTLDPSGPASSNINDMILRNMNQATSLSNDKLNKGMDALRRK